MNTLAFNDFEAVELVDLAAVEGGGVVGAIIGGVGGCLGGYLEGADAGASIADAWGVDKRIGAVAGGFIGGQAGGALGSLGGFAIPEP